MDQTEEIANHIFKEKNKMAETRFDGRTESRMTKKERVKTAKSIRGSWDGSAKDKGSDVGL